MEANEPVTVYTVTNPNEAEIIKMAMQGQGIACQLDGEGQAGLSDILDIGILVPARDADRAQKLIERNEARQRAHAPPVSRMEADRKLEEAVRKAMVYDKRLSSQAIDIFVKDAIACLTGTVQFYGRAVAAYEVAASVPGVREVSKRLVVVPPMNIEDNEVASYVRAALDAHAEVLKEAITVSVSGGVATLEGNVRDAWQHALAEDIVRSARGVRDVSNRLAVDLEQQINDEEISHVIQSAIRHICGCSGADIQVAVSDRAVVLSGRAATLPAKEHAERLARIHGAMNVRNEIQVTPADQR